MPLRDHFRPPVSSRHPWHTLFCMWPTTVVQGVFPILPVGYASGPLLRAEPPYHVDPRPVSSWPAPPPTFAAEWVVPDNFEVRVTDHRGYPRVAAAVEFVAPGDKDEVGARRFVGKVGELLREDAAVVIVDVVTTQKRNLFADLIAHVGGGPYTGVNSALYAAALRVVRSPLGGARLDGWFHPLELGRPLPTLPCGWPKTSQCRSTWTRRTRTPAASCTSRDAHAGGSPCHGTRRRCDERVLRPLVPPLRRLVRLAPSGV